MSREIEFRAWVREGEWEKDGEKQKYIMCYDLAFEEYDTINSQLAGVENLMQFTGLRDANGKKVFEGDIIQHPGSDDFDGRGFVFYAEDFAMFKVKYIDSEGIYDLFECIGWSGMLVIGNIHENIEILEDEKHD